MDKPPDTKHARSVFVAFPFKFGESYRVTLRERFKTSGIEFRYADDMMLNGHVMEKIKRMMREADVCMFDVTGSNPNVMLELGYALGADEPGFVVVRSDAVDQLSADITGWDTLRYHDVVDLADKLYGHLLDRRVPLRQAVMSASGPVIDAEDRLRDLQFGTPNTQDAVLVVYAVPEEYNREYKPRSVLDVAPFRPEDLYGPVCSGITQTQYRAFFWGQSFNYSLRGGRDFIEVYNGNGSDRITNFRIYLSGTTTYTQRLRLGGAKSKPFIYKSSVEQILEMALIAICNAREKCGFNRQGQLNIGAVFLNAEELRISYAESSFYPEGDAGHVISSNKELWMPQFPILTDSDRLCVDAKSLSRNIVMKGLPNYED